MGLLFFPLPKLHFASLVGKKCHAPLPGETTVPGSIPSGAAWRFPTWLAKFRLEECKK